MQRFGVALFIAGILTYFYPVSLSNNQTTGLMVMTIGVIANAASAVLGRSVNKKSHLSPVAVSYTHLRAHETVLDLVCRLLLEKKNTSPIPHAINSHHG